jgi:phosphoglycolate phosphatase-like HAD superfamily hydrolase
MARRWKLKRSELLMVGDYKWDVACAKNAGIRSVVLVNGDGAPDWARDADYVVHRLSDVVKIVKGSPQ